MLANCLFDMVTAAFSAFPTLCNQCGRDPEASRLDGQGGGESTEGQERIGEGGPTSQSLTEMTILRIIDNLALH